MNRSCSCILGSVIADTSIAVAVRIRPGSRLGAPAYCRLVCRSLRRRAEERFREVRTGQEAFLRVK